MSDLFSPDTSLFELFERHLQGNGARIALVGKTETLTYAQLDARAQAIAAHLVHAGVGRGDFVGLVAARSIDAIAAMLGCLRAGAAYVPLDPSFAPEQLDFIARDLPLAAALVEARYAELSKDILPGHVPNLPLDACTEPRGEVTLPRSGGQDPAYVMYTSGTTGKPKGVIVPQRAVAAFSLGLEVVEVTPADRVLHAATIAADGATVEIWAALLNGASVAVVEPLAPSLDDIAQVITDRGVTIAPLYTGLFHLMVDHRIESFSGLRMASAGGDVLSPDHVARLLQAHPGLNVVNFYGPTETTVSCLAVSVTPEMCGGDTPLPIGAPHRHYQTFVVDENHIPLPDGTTGQLAVAGPAVALGYHNRPEKNAEVFIADPRPGQSGRVYLTGDLVARQADGVFTFAGRVDRQVKIGGRRIELDGLEHALRAQPGVRDAAVVVIAPPKGDKRIAAALVADGEQDDLTTRALAGAGTLVNPATLPRLVQQWDELPLTRAGKLDRRAVAARLTQALPGMGAETGGTLRDVIAGIWDDILGCGPVSDDTTFFDAGGTSLQLIDAHAALEARLGRRFDITLMFDTPRLGALAQRLDNLADAAPADRRAHGPGTSDIAIVGLSGRFPGATDLADFWTAVREGKNLVPHFAPDALEDHAAAETRADPAYVPARPVLDDVDMFDAKFFDLLPRDAALMDPQARVFLELCKLALDDAAIDPARPPGPIGVFAGQSMSTYLLDNVLSDRAQVQEFTTTYQLGDYSRSTGNLPDSLATRVAFKLDLKGPALTVATACSTSLTAIAQAVQNLRGGLTDVALAGGVSITFPQKRGYVPQEGGIASDDGVCRPFDASANGTVFGHGAGVVVLKRLADAQAAGDHIYAVIRGVGLNNDGGDKIAYAAPSVAGQSAAIRMAQLDAGVPPETITYVEAHGTATPLGDPIEVAGLTQAFGAVQAGTCALGSVKGTLGHLDAAAGVVSVIKTALMLKHAVLPPMANFSAPNPRINFAEGPFYVPQHAQEWAAEPRRAGVSSFGVGGTNVHLVLEQAPAQTSGPTQEGMCLLPLSAKSPEALHDMAQALADRLMASDAPRLQDVAFTLQEGRSLYPYRLALPARALPEAAEALRAAKPRDRAQDRPEVVFLLPGQGAQYPGMGSGLYASEPEFAKWIDRGARILEPLLGLDINQLLCFGETSDQEAARALRDTRLTQPALYLIQYATARLWMSKGVQPAAMIGHSVGEFAAAALSGVFDFETGLKLIAARGRLMQDQPGGAMLSVRAALEDLRPHLDDSVDLAAMNAPKLQVVAGPFAAIDGLEARLDAAGIAHTRLHTSHAFHSAMMDPVCAALEDELSEVLLNAPTIPYVSCVSGTWITDAQAQDPAYWAGQARAPVNFQAAVKVAGESKSPVLLEVGAGGTLSAFAAQTLARGSHGGIIQTLPDHARTVTDEFAMASAFGRLWAAGVPVNLAAFGPLGHQRVPLPGYAFQRKRHWIDPPAAAPVPPVSVSAAPPAPVESAPVMSTPSSAPRDARLTGELIHLLSDLSGEDLTPDDAAVPFLELGFDSLFMGQVSQALARDYGADISFRSLLNDYPSIQDLAAHLDATLPAEAAPAAAPVPAAPVPQAPALPAPVGATGDVAALIQAQMQTMQTVFAEQLRALGAASADGSAIAAPAAAQQPPAETAPAKAPAKPKEFKVGRAPSLANAELTPDQQAYASDLARRYGEKFPGSKAHTAEFRAVHADPRTVAGFRPEWKELVYPVVCDRAKGAYIWDVDGNRFIDVVNGFGQTAFGHSPDFVSQAIARQLERGYPIGPQADTAGPIAARFARMVGHERVTFCNTGSEAVMAAMRLARAVSGREKIVVFNNDYHGQFDEVLLKGKTRGGDPAALPIAPGIPRSSLSNMVVLPYGAPEAATWIRDNIDSLAAVIIEPVQSRHPELRPVDFVRELREITRAGDVPLIFDEVVTGFRTHARGMQGVWDIEADMATYGKVVGGGMPIGVLAGKRRFMDALDGGDWAYGDASKPETAPTFFAGTFVRHPLVLAAVDATLAHMEEQGARLWTDAAARADQLATRMNAALAERGLPALVANYSSWYLINASQHDPRATLLYPLMRMNGVHTLDGFCGFLTTEHTDADCEAIYQAFVTSVDELRANGILTAEGSATAPKPKAQAPTRAIPLTEGQREIWMVHQLGDTAACVFNEGGVLDLDGPLDVDRLQAALTRVVARHDALRAVFAPSGEQFDVADPAPLSLPVTDLSGQSDPQAALVDLKAQEARLPIDLTAGPPLRAQLVKLAEARHVLLTTAHHIICDGWSYGILFDELARLYREGPDAALPPAPSFATHATAQRARSEHPETIAFWKKQFAHPPALPELPTDAPRPALRSFNGATATGWIDADLAKSVRKAGAKQGATLFATLFAAMQITLGRLSGAQDVVLGVPTGGQALLKDQGLVGHCVNFLPVRAAFDPAEPVGAHLKRAAQAAMRAFDHQDYTFGTLVQQLDLPRGLNRMPLTEVQFNLEKAVGALDFGAVTGTVSPNAKAATNFDLFFNIAEGPGGLRVDVDYNADIYRPETVQRWIGHFESILSALAADPAQPIQALPLVNEQELAALANGPNATAMPFDRTARVEDLIAGAAEAPAAECDGQTLSYAALGERSDALAALIQSQVPGKGARIAVALPRGLDMLVALIAVLKAGHAYVPLDPRQPEGRLRMILETAQTAGLITDQMDRPAFVTDAALPLIRPGQAQPGTQPAPHGAGPQDTAYVIFTSGSTGTPKGVDIPHSAVVNFLTTMAQAPGLSTGDVMLSVTTVSFDIAVLELFLPLTQGAKVVVATADQVLDGFALIERLDQGDITVMQATPTLWDMLLDAGLSPRAGLKVLAGGEPLPRDLARRLLAQGAELWNMYGPTETTIWSAVKRITDAGDISIGRPIGNTDLYVLDPQDQPLPIGALGELNIGGDGLAKGYFNRPDLTQAAFRTVSLAGQQLRLYKTGDLARRRADGEIEVLGRKDTQVKLRGFRIELGEIETRLRALPGIEKAAVDLRTRTNGDRRLVGYIVPAAGTTPLTQDIAAQLATQLPDYMVPQGWVVLTALPQTANGKLDRKALPDPDEAAAVAPLRAATGPETPTEHQLAAIWAEGLGLDEVGVTDTLYALGADSLAVFRIAARMINAGLGLEAKHMLAHPTVRALAAFADARDGQDQLATPGPSRPSLSDFRRGARRKPRGSV